MFSENFFDFLMDTTVNALLISHSFEKIRNFIKLAYKLKRYNRGIDNNTLSSISHAPQYTHKKVFSGNCPYPQSVGAISSVSIL
jgi:hypothetical protein